ncbi:MAG: hypothetical protein WA960_00910 [Tunicatimonas sp.]
MSHYALCTLLIGSLLLPPLTSLVGVSTNRNTPSLVGVFTNQNNAPIAPWVSVPTDQDSTSTNQDKERLLTNARRYLPNHAQQEALIYELQQREADYDSAVHLLKKYIPPTANHYHTNLIDTTAHPFRESVYYASDLMDSGLPEYQQRAFDIFKTIIAQQDQQPEHDTYGIWSYHREETLPQMNKPDWNWADFIAVPLLETYMKHHAVLPPTLRQSMEEAIVHASRSIEKRDVKPGYTNIAIMGTLVTHLSAHLFDLPDLKEYAAMRLRRFYDYTAELQGFAEYNSPTYTRVALNELCRIQQYILDKKARQMIDFCYLTGWQVLAAHFHPPSGQLAGPHSRSYSTLLRKSFYDFLYGASQDQIDYQQAQLPVDYYKLQHRMPASLVPNFRQLPAARIERTTFSTGDNPVVGYTYLHPQYCISSVNRSTTWQQRRPLLAYWGTPAQPRYLQPKLLHDGVEFAAGNIFSVQSSNAVLTTLNFATDGGDYHISIDRLPDGIFRARDLRLRFELGGAELLDSLTVDGRAITLRDGAVQLDIKLLQTLFDGQEVLATETGQDDERCWLDVVLYAGEEKAFDLKQMPQADLSWTTRLWTEADLTQWSDPQAIVKDQRVWLQWDELFLTAPVKPDTEEELQSSFVSRPR